MGRPHGPFSAKPANPLTTSKKSVSYTKRGGIPLTKLSLDQTKLKFLAALFMTIDHMAAYIRNCSLIAAHYTILRSLGRIAAPVFLYCFIETMHHTKSKKAILLRLYAANLLYNLITIICNMTASDIFGFRWVSNIMPTFLYTGIAIVLLDSFRESVHLKNRKKCALILVVCGLLTAFYFAGSRPYGAFLSQFTLGVEPYQNVFGLLLSLLPSPYYVDYSWLFILLGVIWYYVRDQKKQLIIFAAFCGFSFVGSRLSITPANFTDFFDYNQYLMILALPLIWLYNGSRGSGHKFFFYLYYPLHILALIFIDHCLGG